MKSGWSGVGEINREILIKLNKKLINFMQILEQILILRTRSKN